MKNNNLDKLIRDTYIEFNNEIDIYSNLEIPDFNRVINKFHSNIKEGKGSVSLGKRIAMVASFIVVVLVSTLLSSAPQVNAFKFNMIRMVEELKGNIVNIKLSTSDNSEDNSLNNSQNNKGNNSNLNVKNDKPDQVERTVSMDELKKEVHFKVLLPQYLPNGYKLDNIKLVTASSNSSIVRQNYVDNKGEYIYIAQTILINNKEETFAFSSQFRRENLDVNDLKVILYTNDKDFKKMLWVRNNIKFEITVPYNITDGEIIKIIKLLR